MPQSQQLLLPGNALTTAWSCAVICTMVTSNLGCTDPCQWLKSSINTLGLSMGREQRAPASCGSLVRNKELLFFALVVLLRLLCGMRGLWENIFGEVNFAPPASKTKLAHE